MTSSAAPSSALTDAENPEVRRAVAQASVVASAAGSAAVSATEGASHLHAQLPDLAKRVDLKKIELPRFPVHLGPKLPTEIGPFQTGYITFNNGVPVGGWVNLELHSDGTCTLRGHFHDSGAPSYDIEFVWIVVDSAGHAYSFAVKGHMAGTFESGSRDFNFSITTKSDDIRTHWAKLAAGYRWHWSAHVGMDMQKALDDAIGYVKTAGQVIGAVAPIIAAF